MFGDSFSYVAPCLLDSMGNKKSMETPMKSFGTNFGNFFDEYVLTDFLGSGSYSVCKLGEHKATGQKFAVKVSGFSTILLKRTNGT